MIIYNIYQPVIFREVIELKIKQYLKKLDNNDM